MITTKLYLKLNSSNSNLFMTAALSTRKRKAVIDCLIWHRLLIAKWFECNLCSVQNGQNG